MFKACLQKIGCRLSVVGLPKAGILQLMSTNLTSNISRLKSKTKKPRKHQKRSRGHWNYPFPPPGGGGGGGGGGEEPSSPQQATGLMASILSGVHE